MISDASAPGRSEFSKSPWPWILVLVAGILSYGLILFTDYPIWDGWWESHFIRNADEWPLLRRAFTEGGHPIDVWYYSLLRPVHDPVLWSKWSGVACWIVTPLAFIKATRAGDVFTELDRWAIALVGVVLPFFDVLGELNAFPSTVAILLFWVGWWAFFASSSFGGSRKLALRGISLAVLFLSFNLNSELPFFYAFLAVALVYKSGAKSAREFGRYSLKHAHSYAGVILLPLIFWWWKTRFTPTYASGVDYNAVKFDLRMYADGYRCLFAAMAGETSLVFSWVAALPVIGSALVFVLWSSRHPSLLSRIPHESWEEPAKLFLSGACLFVSAAFAYVAVGKFFDASGWKTRDAILLNYPAATVIVGALKLAHGLFFPRKHVLVGIILCGLVVACIIKSNLATLRLQAMAAKHYSIIRRLRAGLVGTDVNVVNLRDYFPIEGAMNFYPPLIWSYMLAGGRSLPKVMLMDSSYPMWAGPGRLPVDAEARGDLQVDPETILPTILAETTNTPFMWESIPLQGTARTAFVKPGSCGTDPVQIGFEYLRLKYFAPKQLDGFIRSLTLINIVTPAGRQP